MEKASTYVFAGRLIRNAEVRGSTPLCSTNNSRFFNHLQTQRRQTRFSQLANIWPEKTTPDGKEQLKMGTDRKTLTRLMIFKVLQRKLLTSFCVMRRSGVTLWGRPFVIAADEISRKDKLEFPPGLVASRDGYVQSLGDQFVKSIARHRHWEPQATS